VEAVRPQLAFNVDDLGTVDEVIKQCDTEEMKRRIIGQPTITEADRACSAPPVGANRT
jgi:hypothetical protein